MLPVCSSGNAGQVETRAKFVQAVALFWAGGTLEGPHVGGGGRVRNGAGPGPRLPSFCALRAF
eukprot:12355878-Alexandrium_andersonii.AAC.1